MAEPTAMELDAALADVRVRAVPIARRNARNARAMKLLVGVLAVGGSFVAGRAYANGGVRVGVDTSTPSHWKGEPVLVAASDGARPVAVLPSVGPTVQRFHITSWTEWSGERYNQSESWIEGPPGVTFSLRVATSGDEFRGQFAIYSTQERTNYQSWTQVRHQFGMSPRGLELTERGYANVNASVARGQPVVLYPFGRGDWTEPVTMVRIEGPDLPAPQGNLRWEQPESTPAFQFDDFGYGTISERQAAFMRSIGVRTAVVRAGSLGVAPVYNGAPNVLRISLVGRQDFAETQLGSGRFQLPGIDGNLAAWMSGRRSNSGDTLCVYLRRSTGEDSQIDLRAGRLPLRASGCITHEARWRPFEVMSNQGQRIRIQLVQVLGVNY